MTEDEMFRTLVLPRNRVGTLRSLQRAVQLFDRISTIPPQVCNTHNLSWGLAQPLLRQALWS